MVWPFFNRENRVNAVAQGLNVAIGLLAVADYVTNPEANTALYGASLVMNMATGIALRGEYGAGQLASLVGNIAYAGMLFGQTVGSCNEVSGTTLLMEGVAMGANLATTFYNAGVHHAKRNSLLNEPTIRPMAQPS